MKLLFENWRKYLKEQKLLKEYTYFDQMSEDDLYDLEYQDLVELRDYIEDFGGPGPTSDPNDLYPTIVARIEAIEESAEAEWEKAPHLEPIYSGEYAIKLAKAFIGSSKMGIDLALMIPDAESLVEEFRRIRDRVQELLHRAENGDSSPWAWRPDATTPDRLLSSMDALIKQLTYYPGEITWDNKDEVLEEQQEIWSMYERWKSAMEDLEIYAHYKLHGGTFAPSYLGGTAKYINSHHLIEDWVGEE